MLKKNSIFPFWWIIWKGKKLKMWKEWGRKKIYWLLGCNCRGGGTFFLSRLQMFLLFKSHVPQLALKKYIVVFFFVCFLKLLSTGDDPGIFYSMENDLYLIWEQWTKISKYDDTQSSKVNNNSKHDLKSQQVIRNETSPILTKILLWTDFSFYNVRIYLCMGMCLQMCAATVTTERYFYNYAVKEENVSQLLVILVVCIVTWKYVKMSWLYLKKISLEG